MTCARAAALAVAVALGAGASGCSKVTPETGLEPGKAFDVKLISGKVRLSTTGRTYFDLEKRSRIPAGGRVDARHGVVEIIAARPGGRTESARVSGALFALDSASAGARTALVRGDGGTGAGLELRGPRSFFEPGTQGRP